MRVKDVGVAPKRAPARESKYVFVEDINGLWALETQTGNRLIEFNPASAEGRSSYQRLMSRIASTFYARRSKSR